MLSVGYQKLICQIAGGGYQASLSEVSELLELDGTLGVLGKVNVIGQFLESINAQVIPGLGKGEVDTVRLFRFRSPQGASGAEVIEGILRGDESHTIEFKSTLRVDLRRLAQPGQTAAQCKSDEVLHASLKTIAAFMNSSGGQLIIGISDDKQVNGLHYDFELPDTASADKFELLLRNCLTGKFKDGGLINDYVSLTFVETHGHTVAIIEVLPRSSLSFVKKDGQYALYRRQGNRTNPVDISDIEEFLKARWGLAG
ncbi:Putative DNA-binding domain-containing protein [Aromatoleum tolulyticum]|uniref:Putative DNA-binding domain-containing protein n=1 Tax=Aromatoleum tolulyticum TaxID=34027 RepID=A0A1N6TIA7_9RHOO|nr:ATP-binding protein [Aromatoleum tolulyticum]SIQ52977.1 Putative DNA-binding domain-containing protein [Aromatoleum tolulyticum]